MTGLNGTRPLRYLLGALMLLLLAPMAIAERQSLDRVVAVVDEGVVLQSELQSRVQQIESRLRAQGTRLPPDEVLRKRVLDQLILERIQIQRARQMGMRIGDNELNRAMQDVASNNGFSSLDAFEQALASEGLSFQQAREQIRREMLISRIQQQLVGRRIRITEREVENFLESSQARENSGIEYLLGHILISVNNFSDEEEVDAARSRARDIRQRLDNGADFREVAVAQSDGRNALEGGELGWRTEQELPSLAAGEIPELEVGEASDVLRSGSGFHIVTPLDRRGDEGSGNEVEQHRVRHILISTENRSSEEAQSLAQDLAEQLDKGASFTALAREYSDDPGTASEGGDLGWINPGEMVPAFEETMNATEVGRQSDPFRSRFGWHILEVEEERTAEIGDQVQRRQARQALQQRRFELELQNWLNQIREEAYVEVKTVVSGMEPVL
ncbi:periplasmic chaperone for outer membrane proteins SurA [Halospina denitrificans]|uniref:Chaperone SurA n=1 Tax=Halospina denitrificans TaxID=332522 RepID=A0A4R7JQ32_9GAMM|nr:peptidylprolyl isomerase [Halospina denitrificans]TDT40220.1 periplasmic chaperone for outer membrane proteins SurA [Halospina denitrificans]